MSSQMQSSSGQDDTAAKARRKNPACPQCRRLMTVKQASSVLFASGLDDVIYRCEDCGTEAKRTVKRD